MDGVRRSDTGAASTSVAAREDPLESSLNLNGARTLTVPCPFVPSMMVNQGFRDGMQTLATPRLTSTQLQSKGYAMVPTSRYVRLGQNASITMHERKGTNSHDGSLY